MQPRSAAHQRAAPVRRRPEMCVTPAAAGARQELVGPAHRRSTARDRRAGQHGAQVDLQAAVTADVVEGAPDLGAAAPVAAAFPRGSAACATTSFGLPVVPDVSSIHSVRVLERRVRSRPSSGPAAVDRSATSTIGAGRGARPTASSCRA